MSLLERINSPRDLAPLTIEELQELAREIRQLIVEVVARNGGHLSSNLGAVDLTIALHRIFDTPKDRIIWDVGHQCYTHKILTGRKDRIFSIRQKDGLIGYPDIRESEYDVLNTGHASTSIAFASGLALARDHAGEDHHIVCVIGDGALTGGVALEALNHIGQIKPRMIIILNDNKMSIAPNVGGISRHLSYLVAGRPYIRLKELVQSILKFIPGIGRSMIDLARKLETLIRTVMVPGSLFDELGVKYIGPINGHNLREMEKEFESAKKYDFPVLLHVVTKKGFGYQPASDRPSSYHSSNPFRIEDGSFKTEASTPSFSTVFGKTLACLMERDEKMVALTAAMPDGTGLDIAAEKFPGRVYDVGIAEQYMFDLAGGLALGKMKPVVAIYSTFLQRSVDQIIHDISLMNLPVIVGIDRSGLVGGDGPTHQGIYDIALLRPIPDLVLTAPRDEREMADLLYTATQVNKPFFIRYPKESTRAELNLEESFRLLPLGTSEILRPGRDGMVFVAGPMVYTMIRVAERLSEEKVIDLGVVNLCYIKPLDLGLITEQLKRRKSILGRRFKVITLEDGVLAGGVGESIRDLIYQNHIRHLDLLSLGIPECEIPVASRKELLHLFELDEPGLYRRIRLWLNGESADDPRRFE
jgi:1-deoxy-D-xylulose-5-phosphate synthase